MWPVHLKPKKDELLSSWLVRLAIAHGLKLHTFCSVTWPGKSIWNLDIDKSADADILYKLSDRTGTKAEDVRATTLAAYEGILYEKHNRFGPIAWIMPVGVFHRRRRKFGLQYCSFCLAEDNEPFYRRRWRLAFIVICERHHCILQDRCPNCQEPVNFHRNELGDPKKIVATSLTLCYSCGYDLRQAITNKQSVNPIRDCEVQFTLELLKVMDDGFMQISDATFIHSHLYFTVLRQLMKIGAREGKNLDNLRQDLRSTYGIDIYLPLGIRPQPDVQEQNIQVRRQLLQFAHCLLLDWPDRFITLARKHKLWSSLWLRNLDGSAWDRSRTAPFWYWSVIHDHLYRAPYHPSNQEIQSAIRYLAKDRGVINKSVLARLLGIAVVRRRELLEK